MILRSPAVNLITPVNWQHPLNRGLVAWWLVMPGNNAGSKLVDITKYGNDGTLTNMNTATAWKGANRLGSYGALDFDGSNDYVNLGSDVETNISQFSLSAWVRWTRGGTQAPEEVVVSRWADSEANKMYLWRWDSATSSMEFFTNTSGDDVLTSSDVDLSDLDWHLINATFDGSTMRQYIDGVVSTSTTATTGATNSNATVVTAGLDTRDATTELDGFLGLISDIRIYNCALSESEILHLYQDSLLGYPHTLNYIRRPLVAAAGVTSDWYYRQQQAVIA